MVDSSVTLMIWWRADRYFRLWECPHSVCTFRPWSRTCCSDSQSSGRALWCEYRSEIEWVFFQKYTKNTVDIGAVNKNREPDTPEGLQYIEPTIDAVEGLLLGISQVFYISDFFWESRVFIQSFVVIEWFSLQKGILYVAVTLLLYLIFQTITGCTNIESFRV